MSMFFALVIFFGIPLCGLVLIWILNHAEEKKL